MGYAILIQLHRELQTITQMGNLSEKEKRLSMIELIILDLSFYCTGSI